MQRVVGGIVVAAGLLAAAPAAWAGDSKGGDAEARLAEVLAELDAQRAEINALKARLAEGGGGAGEGGIADAVKKYLESDDGRKALGKGLESDGFVKAGFGSLKITGFLQAWYTFQRDPEDGNDPGGDGGGTAGVDSFRLRRGELKVMGTIIKDQVDWAMMIDPARALANDETTAQTARILQEFIITYKNPFSVSKEIAVDVGQFKFPFGREALQSTWKRDFIDTAEGTKFFTDARRPAAQVRGVHANGGVEWWLNFHQTRGQNTNLDFNDQKNKVARFVLNPFKFGAGEKAKKWGDLAVGASYMRGYATSSGIAFRRRAVEVEWRKEKLFGEKDGGFLRTEWFHGDVPGATENDRPTTARSHYFAAGYGINENWQVVARHDEIERVTSSNLVHVVRTLGVNYFLKGHYSKISLNWIKTKERDQMVHDSMFIFQFQVAF